MRLIFRTIGTVLLIAISITLVSCSSKESNKKNNDFSFVFMTDIHLEPARNAPLGFTQAMDTINKLNPDFVITGGDLIADALGQKYSRADSLYNLYATMIRHLKMPVYNSMGNHEVFGLYDRSVSDESSPDYGEKMFEHRFGQSYYSFEHKGWKFMIINSVEDTHKHSYTGWIDSTQINWIKSELSHTAPETPIVLSTHIPFISAYEQRFYGSTIANDSSLVVANSKEVLDLFKAHNLKMVLQGHLHEVEDVFIDGVHYVTGGAVSAAWWTGPHSGFEEGFMLLTVSGNDIKWKYIDYGWEVKK
jgi:3',5'-cyclic-AMP phosphodiesterase